MDDKHLSRRVQSRKEAKPPGTRVPDRPWPAFLAAAACMQGWHGVGNGKAVSYSCAVVLGVVCCGVKSDVHREHGLEVSRTRASKGRAGQGRARQGWTRLGYLGTEVPRRQRGDDEGQVGPDSELGWLVHSERKRGDGGRGVSRVRREDFCVVSMYPRQVLKVDMGCIRHEGSSQNRQG